MLSPQIEVGMRENEQEKKKMKYINEEATTMVVLGF